MIRSMSRFALAALLLLLWSTAAPVPPASAQQAAPVAVVVLRAEGGDSLRVMFGRVEKSLRLDGVRVAPCMAAEATTRLHGLAAGRAALLDYDRVSYAATGELSGFVWIDGVMLNVLLVSEGYAVYRPGTSTSAYDREAVAAQQAAATDGAGLWSRCPSAAT